MIHPQPTNSNNAKGKPMSFDPLFVVHPLIEAYQAGKKASSDPSKSFFHPPYPRWAWLRRGVWQEGFMNEVNARHHRTNAEFIHQLKLKGLTTNAKK